MRPGSDAAETRKRILHQRTHIHAACFLTAGQGIFFEQSEQRKVIREDIESLVEMKTKIRGKYNIPNSIFDRMTRLSIELLKYTKSEAVPNIEYITAFWMSQVFFIEEQMMKKRRDIDTDEKTIDSADIANNTLPPEILAKEINTTVTSTMEFIQLHIHLLRTQDVLTKHEFNTLRDVRECILETIRKHVAVADQEDEDESIPTDFLGRKAESGLAVDCAGDIKALFETLLSPKRKPETGGMGAQHEGARRCFFILLAETQADKELGKIARESYDFILCLSSLITILFTSATPECAVREYKKFVRENPTQTDYRSLFVIDMIYMRFWKSGDRFFRSNTRELHRYILDILVWYGELPMYEGKHLEDTGVCFSVYVKCLFRESPDINETRGTFWYKVQYRVHTLLNVLSEFVSLSDSMKKTARNVVGGLMRSGQNRIFVENGTKWGVILVLCILLRHRKSELSVSAVMCAATAIEGYDGLDSNKFGASVWKESGRYEEVVEEYRNEAAYEKHHISFPYVEQEAESFLQWINDDYSLFIAEHKQDNVH
ncbi:MAG: uncharacterized protein A8A55_0496 [Amphiamblys sp. WSBS2006]|nr:MAG: uncharacterized protein A8A55_0496 [Amphiamblys sp. WSBS2006]